MVVTVAETSFTIFSDADSPRWANSFAELLRNGPSVDVNILEAALDGDADVPEAARWPSPP